MNQPNHYSNLTDVKVASIINADLPGIQLRKMFWTILLECLSPYSKAFSAVDPGNRYFIKAKTPVKGVYLQLCFSTKYFSVDLVLSKTKKGLAVYKMLHDNLENIENEYGYKINWQNDPSKTLALELKYEGVNNTDPGDWPKVIELMCERMIRFEKIMCFWLSKFEES